MNGMPGSAPDDPKARLLIVDDEPQIRSALVRALNLMGYQAEGAGSGYEALNLLADQAYDLMLLDLHLPGIDGITVMKRARLVHPNLMIVILTGRPSVESAVAAVKLRAADYLIKPVSVNEIVAAIRQTLQERTRQL